MRKKDKEWVENFVSERVARLRLAEMDIEYNGWQVSNLFKLGGTLQDRCDRLEKDAGANKRKPSFMPASHAKVLSEHGKDSNDWKDYLQNKETAIAGINGASQQGLSEFAFTTTKFSQLLIDELESLGYRIEFVDDHVWGYCKITW